MDLLLLAGLVALLLLWVVVRNRQSQPRPADKADVRIIRPSQTNSAYHAVSIRPGRRVCQRVKELDGKRLLSSEAPMLPVPGCDVADCECSFVHYKDRRCGKDRRSPFHSGALSATTGKFQVERRERGERRRDEELSLY